MIQLNELRIGNWVLGHTPYSSGKKYFKVESIYKGQINYLPDVQAGDSYALNVEGIELTPEILEKCGFVKIAGSYEKGIFVFGHRKQVLIYNGEQGESPIEMDHIKHLHQLQNLYFSLTGEELNYQP